MALIQPLAQRLHVVGVLDRLGGLPAFILERVDPFATLILGGLRGVQRIVGPRKAALHHLDVVERPRPTSVAINWRSWCLSSD